MLKNYAQESTHEDNFVVAYKSVNGVLVCKSVTTVVDVRRFAYSSHVLEMTCHQLVY